MIKYVIKSTKIDGINVRLTKYKGDRRYRLIMRNTGDKVNYGLNPNQQTERKLSRRKDAIEAFEKVKAMVLTLREPAEHKPTIKQLVHGYTGRGLDEPGWIKARSHELKKSTLEGYKRTFRLFEHGFGKRRVAEIKGREVYDWLLEWFDVGKSFNTIKNHKNHISNLFGYAIMREYIDINPVSRFKLRKPPVTGLDKGDMAGALDKVGKHRYLENPPDPFSEAERDAFEATVKAHYPHYYALVVTGFRCGLRIGEMCSLSWPCVDFEDKLIKIRLNYTHYELSDAKHSHKRDVPMPDDLIAVLRKQELYVKTMAIKMGRKIEVVFPNQEGGMDDGNNMARNFMDAAFKKAGVRRRTMHNLRDTYASLRLSKGHSIEEVAKHLGHYNPEITFKHYYQYIKGASVFDVNDISPV